MELELEIKLMVVFVVLSPHLGQEVGTGKIVGATVSVSRLELQQPLAIRKVMSL